MGTASHSPVGQTGFKLCDSLGRPLLKADYKKLESLANKVNQPYKPADLKNKTKSIDFISIVAEYKKFALSFVKPESLKGLKIILDASVGSGARLANDVFAVLPATTTYINFGKKTKTSHGPNPLLPENQQAIKREIKKQQANLGVIFDGDADRAIFFDETGQLVEPYYVNCLLSQIKGLY